MTHSQMVVLFTDFGIQDHYVGQLKSVLTQSAPDIAIIDLLHQAPVYNIRAAAYLLAALIKEIPKESIFLCVIDPGVGSERPGCVARIDDHWFVGPDNGLFTVVQQRAKQCQWWRIKERQYPVSASFHGRDIFAPVAAELAKGDLSSLQAMTTPVIHNDWSADLKEVIYIDHYGNLITGYRYSQLGANINLYLGAKKIDAARTFSDVKVGEGFYYSNSNGLLEIAVNQGNAADQFQARIGDKIELKVNSEEDVSDN